jgi:hypothetical protein
MNHNMRYLILLPLLALGTACASPYAPQGGSPLPTTSTTIDNDDPIFEDDPRWNCLTMGNRTCGPNYQPVDQPLADALAEGAKDDATTYDWESCLVAYGDTTIIVCPDGYVETS